MDMSFFKANLDVTSTDSILDDNRVLESADSALEIV